MEDNYDDYLLIEEYLNYVFVDCLIFNARTLYEAEKFIVSPIQFNAIILDLSLPDSNRKNSVERILEISNNIPVIVLTGFSDKDFAIETLALGVSDYLLKKDLTVKVLHKSILYSIERQKVNEKLKLSEQRFKSLVQDGADLIGIIDKNGNYIYVSPASESIFGFKSEQLIGKNIFDLIYSSDKKKVEKSFKHIQTIKKVSIPPYRFKNKKNKYLWIETVITNMLDDPSVKGIVVNSRNVTEKINYEQKINQAIITTQEQERFQISSELHDNINQLLAASQIYISTAIKKINDPTTQQLLSDSRLYVSSAISEIRKISHRLSPGLQSNFSISEALSELIKGIDVSKKLKLSTIIDPENINLPYDLRLNLYRILQEQFINIIKHSNATEVVVSLQIFNNALVMKTTDNGKGINFSDHRKGIGLSNMKKRTSLFSGTIKINSKKSYGVEIIIEIPL